MDLENYLALYNIALTISSKKILLVIIQLKEHSKATYIVASKSPRQMINKLVYALTKSLSEKDDTA